MHVSFPSTLIIRDNPLVTPHPNPYDFKSLVTPPMLDTTVLSPLPPQVEVPEEITETEHEDYNQEQWLAYVHYLIEHVER